MINLDNVITLKTNTETEKLSFYSSYLVGIHFTFVLTVRSDTFSGSSSFCVQRQQLDSLCRDLLAMYSSLDGKTRLDDNDSDAFVEFEIESAGWLFVRGQVGGSHEDHMLKFYFKTDQTSLPRFVADFKLLLRDSY